LNYLRIGIGVGG